MKTEKTWGFCCLYIVGMEMACPLCGALVKSGEEHICTRPTLESAPMQAKSAKALSHP